ncbi:MAG: prenyltransferase/squalene oxidase repeat-containing protein [Planctomycetota bacterium]
MQTAGLPIDPLPALLAEPGPALNYFVRRDLLGEEVPEIEQVWDSAEVRQSLRGQQEDGSWPKKRTQPDVWPGWHYPLFETWKRLRVLVQQYQLTVEHPGCRAACEFVLSCQQEEGDIRGLLANQYATYYTGALTYLLIRAGLADDPRVHAALDWLLSIRQDDGGWSLAMIDHNLSREEQHRLSTQYAPPLEPDRSRPFTHMVTGMVLRAFAAHEGYRNREEIQHAGRLLKSRFFQPDSSSSYKAAAYWTIFNWPYWWNDLVSALDSLEQLRLPADDPEIAAGLAWFFEHQRKDGLFDLTSINGRTATGPRAATQRGWTGLNIVKLIRRFAAP